MLMLGAEERLLWRHRRGSLFSLGGQHSSFLYFLRIEASKNVSELVERETSQVFPSKPLHWCHLVSVSFCNVPITLFKFMFAEVWHVCHSYRIRMLHIILLLLQRIAIKIPLTNLIITDPNYRSPRPLVFPLISQWAYLSWLLAKSFPVMSNSSRQIRLSHPPFISSIFPILTVVSTLIF